jgi:hypothetical protein
MARGSVARLFALFAPALAACSFILDFDGLTEGAAAGSAGAGLAGNGGGESGKGGSGGKGGTGGEGGLSTGGVAGESAGEGGEGGGGDCPPSCDDEDPCTVDSCTSTGACRHEPATGLFLDGVDERIPADTHYRVTIASASDAFFLSSFSAEGTEREVTFYRLDAEASDDALSEVATLGGLDLGGVGAGDPLSAAGLAVEPALGLIHGFIGIADRVGMGTRVWHIVLDQEFAPQLRMPVDASYWSGSPYNHPAAINLRGDIYTAWITEDLTVRLAGGRLAAPATLAATTPATTLTLLGTASGDPVVLYTEESGGVTLESPSMAPVDIPECQPDAGAYTSASATDTTIPGFWLTSWTKFGSAAATDEGFLTTDGRGVGCSDMGCLLDEMNCSANSASNLVRNQALLTGVRPGDPNGLVTFVQALPLLLPGTEEGEARAVLGLVGARVDFGRVPFMNEPTSAPLGDPVNVSDLPTTAPDFRGPDWPVLAFVPPDRVALSFIEPGSDGDDLRIQRYRVCYGE